MSIFSKNTSDSDLIAELSNPFTLDGLREACQDAFDERAEHIVCESVEQYTEDGFTVEHHVNDEYIGSHPLWIEFMGNRFTNY